VRAIDGQPVLRVSDLVAAIDRRQVGETVSMTIIRDGHEQVVPVVLGAFPDRG
jgi:S1-C subfamily serine protease